MVIILQCIEILNLNVVHQVLTQYCGSILFQRQTNKLTENEIRFVVTRGGGGWKWGLDEGIQKVQTSSYEIKYQRCNVQHYN